MPSSSIGLQLQRAGVYCAALFKQTDCAIHYFSSGQDQVGVKLPGRYVVIIWYDYVRSNKEREKKMNLNWDLLLRLSNDTEHWIVKVELMALCVYVCVWCVKENKNSFIKMMTLKR